MDYEGSAPENKVLKQERRVSDQIRQWNERYVDQLPDFGAGPVVSWTASAVTFLFLLSSALIFTNQERFSKKLYLSDEEN